MRKWQAMLPVAALIAASGCQELPTEEEVGGPQAQAVTVEAANSEQEPGSGSASTVCDVFRAELLDARVRLAERPDDAVTVATVSAIERILPHTCD